MSGLLYRLGRGCYRHHWRAILAWLLILLLAGLGYVGFHGKFDDQFKLPGSQSMVALDQLEQTFPEVSGSSATMVVVAPDGHTLTEPGIKDQVQAATHELEDLHFVNAVVDPYDPNVHDLLTQDQRAGMTTIRIPGSVSEITDADRAAMTDAGKRLESRIPGSTVRVGGEAFSAKMPKITVTEALGVGVALVVLFFTLGSVVAAGLPVVTALVGVGVSMLVLMMSTKLVEINSASPMLALMLGLAVGIDYALFILSRHRDQLAEGMDPEESTARAVATAGSAVIFAGLTVVIALLGLFICNIPFLSTMGFFAALAVAVAVTIALTLLPAFMGVLGARMVPKRRRSSAQAEVARDGANRAVVAPADATAGEAGATAVAPRGRNGRRSASAWWVDVATKVPLLTVVLVIAALGALALPAKDMVLALPNSGHHARTEPDRQTYDLISEHFGPGYNGPLLITSSLVQSRDPLGLMNDLKGKVEAVPGVQSVPLATPNRNADTGIVQIVPTTAPDDPRTTELVKQLRADLPAWEKETGAKLAVTGSTAVQIDVTDQLGAALLPFGIFVVGLSVLLLMMVFRSVFVPIKAALGYLLSVASAFGATTLVFNKGWMRQVINLQDPVPIISFFPIIFMGILFGLAMDYEVFLVSRMREEHVHGTPAREAVKSGFVHSAKVVVAAALIMFSVFAFFVPEGDTTLKPIAFGLALGVAIDAFLVRMTLVPAVMMLAGEKAWWLPRWLDRILPSFDVEGETLAHQLAYADWPHPDSRALIYAEDLAVHDGDATLLAPTSVRVDPGQVLRVSGPAPARAALLLALAGKLAPSSGEGKVGGKLLSTQAGDVRRRVSYVDARTPDPVRELAAARDVVLIDDADLVAQAHPDAIRELLGNVGERAVVLAGADERALATVAPSGQHLALPEDARGLVGGGAAAGATAAVRRDDRLAVEPRAQDSDSAEHRGVEAAVVAEPATRPYRRPGKAPGEDTEPLAPVAPPYRRPGKTISEDGGPAPRRAAGLSVLNTMFDRQQGSADSEGDRR